MRYYKIKLERRLFASTHVQYVRTNDALEYVSSQAFSTYYCYAHEHVIEYLFDVSKMAFRPRIDIFWNCTAHWMPDCPKGVHTETINQIKPLDITLQIVAIDDFVCRYAFLMTFC